MATGEHGCVDVRFYRESDEEQVLSVLEAAFPAWPNVEVAVDPVDHLRWKLSSHPVAMRHHLVAECDGRIVAARCLWGQRALAKGRELLLRQGIDTSVHPDYQGRGVMAEVRRFAPEAFVPAFDLHFGNQSVHPAMVALWEKEGQRRIGNRVEVFERPLHARDAPPPAVAGDWSIASAGHFDERIDELWREACGGFDFIIVRDRAYLNWRYCDPRAGAFTVRLAERDGRILGYCVLRMLRGKGYIADLLVLPERMDVAGSLVRDAVAHFVRAGAPAVRCWTMSHHPYNTMLAGAGFSVRRRRKRELSYRLLGASAASLAFLDEPATAFHFPIGDTDLV